MINNFDGWIYGQDREDKPTITIDVKYYYKDFSEPERDLDGIVCKSKWYRFKIHEMPRFDDNLGHYQIEEKSFTLHSQAAWEYLPDYYNNVFIGFALEKYKKMLREMLLLRVQKLVKEDFELQMVEQDMKNDYHIKFNFVQIVDPPDEFR